MMPPIKITSITTANIKKVLSMVTPFVRTRHPTKWNTTAHLSRMRLNRHHSPDKAATNDTGEIDIGEQPGPLAPMRTTIPPNLFLTQYAVKWLGQDVFEQITRSRCAECGKHKRGICKATRRYCERDHVWGIEPPHRLMNRL